MTSRGSPAGSGTRRGSSPAPATTASAPGNLTFSGPRQVLPSVFDVTGLATASVAAATLAVAEFHAASTGTPPRPVTVDSRAASAAFACEALFTPVGWTLPAIWDPIAGNYQARDGWIRLHTNYAHHRAAVQWILSPYDKDGAQDRQSVATLIRGLKASELEDGIVESAGGCAAVMRTREEWLASPQGAATAHAPVLDVGVGPVRGPADDAIPPPALRLPSPDVRSVARGNRGQSRDRAPAGGVAAPYAGIRVLDLTRVIAGPIATRFLAAYGADVLRVDPPGFAEVPACLPETTAGKRTAALDLKSPADRATFEDLIATADVMVTGLRADALARLGYDEATVAAINPGLIRASLNAYGWAGPWRNRRGFDSLVQMSCGIAAAGARAAGKDSPTPLPVQALDHATGYLVAAAVGRALTRRITGDRTSRIRACLIGTAGFLCDLPRPGGAWPPMPRPADIPLEETRTAWGPARRVPLPGQIEGIAAGWHVEPGPLGRHAPAWAE